MRTNFIVVLFILALSGCAAAPYQAEVPPPPPESETGPFSRTDLDTSWRIHDRDTGQVFYHYLDTENKTLDELEREYEVAGNEIIYRDNDLRTTTVASGFNTIWTVCFTGFSEPQECHPINLMDVTRYDPTRVRTNFAKMMAGRDTEEARKYDDHWLFVALRALERKINRDTPDFVVIKVDADRTWHIIPH